MEPAWVTTALRLTPTPAIATVAIVISVFASLMCFFFASAEDSPVGWALCALVAAPAVWIGTASASRHLRRRDLEVVNSRQTMNLKRLPTVAIVAGFISVSSWMLMIGLHVFRNLFAANRPGGLKYNVTLGIALASSLYMALQGRSVIGEYIFPRVGRYYYMTIGQATLVVALLLSFGVYVAWIMG